MASNREKAIIEKRMMELLHLTFEDEKNQNFADASRKIELIFLYSQKYKVKIPYEARIWFCRKCKSGIYANGGHIRIKKSAVNVHCGKCGYTRRFKIVHQ